MVRNEDKARLYDDYIRESENLQRQNSRIKSENAGNITLENQKVIDANDVKIAAIIKKVEALFR